MSGCVSRPYLRSAVAVPHASVFTTEPSPLLFGIPVRGLVIARLLYSVHASLVTVAGAGRMAADRQPVFPLATLASQPLARHADSQDAAHAISCSCLSRACR